jgi:DNA-binding NarL/FixJ family response regulator
VLIVDGSAVVGVRLVALLRDARHEVVGIAATAAAAIAQARALRPEAIVVDPHLPDHCGPDVVGALREHAPAAMLVVISSEPQPRYRARCAALGADYFFDKASQFDAVAPTLAVAEARSRR